MLTDRWSDGQTLTVLLLTKSLGSSAPRATRVRRVPAGEPHRGRRSFIPGAMSSSKDPPTSVWQDREIKFDVAESFLELRTGEFQIDRMGRVEDTKGNNGESGELVVTNLRILWIASRRARTNLSVGYNSIVSINIKSASSRLRGRTQALYVMTKFQGSRFEFIFTNLVNDSPRLFTTVQAVFRAYDTSKLYRDLKLRGAIIADKELKLLPKEEVYNKIPGVWNLSNDRGNLGTFHVTNVRVVWHANAAENFNVSVPYVQIRSATLRESKFGRCLVINTTQRSGGYVLGFRVEPAERLPTVHQEIDALLRVFGQNPVFGVEFSVEEKAESIERVTVARESDDVEIVDERGGEDNADAFAAYYAEGGDRGGAGAGEREPTFDPTLGLAVEPLPEGTTPAQLWNIA
jgi:Bardet-Biedl syndrome 5 protein